MTEPSASQFTELLALRDEVGQLRNALSVQAEKEVTLLSKLHKFELAAGGANDGLWDWDLLTNEVFVSKAWVNMLGFAEEEVEDPSKFWLDRMHPAASSNL